MQYNVIFIVNYDVFHLSNPHFFGHGFQSPRHAPPDNLENTPRFQHLTMQIPNTYFRYTYTDLLFHAGNFLVEVKFNSAVGRQATVNVPGCDPVTFEHGTPTAMLPLYIAQTLCINDSVSFELEAPAFLSYDSLRGLMDAQSAAVSTGQLIALPHRYFFELGCILFRSSVTPPPDAALRTVLLDRIESLRQSVLETLAAGLARTPVDVFTIPNATDHDMIHFAALTRAPVAAMRRLSRLVQRPRRVRQRPPQIAVPAPGTILRTPTLGTGVLGASQGSTLPISTSVAGAAAGAGAGAARWSTSVMSLTSMFDDDDLDAF